MGLGTGDFRDRGEPIAVEELPPAIDVEVSSTGGFTCAIAEDGVYCWGDDTAGQLGDGARHDGCFDGVSAYDCSARPVRVANIDADDIAELTLGRSHACALTHAGEVFCWGAGGRGQLGQGSFEASNVPTRVATVERVAAIGAGGSFTCLLNDGGRVSCFGDNAFGQLGDGRWDHGSVCVRGSTVADCAAAPVWAEGVHDATRLAVGSAHVCVLRGDASVACWGLNHEKQLGDGTREERAVPGPSSHVAPG